MPTFAEGGVTGAESYTWHMVLAPAGTPAPVVQAANAAFNRVAAMEGVQRRLSDLTMTTRSDTTPEMATRWMLDETTTKNWDELFALNLRAYFLTIREASRHMNAGASIVKKPQHIG